MRLVLTDAEIERFWSKVGRGADEECWPWEGGRFNTGYGAFKLRATRNNAGAHRIMCKLVHGVEPEVVMHTCDNPPCVNPAHLVPATFQLNVLDARAKGRIARGERHGNAKLTTAQVHEIADLIRAGEALLRIAERYGVSRRLIEGIAYGTSWTHITGGAIPRPRPPDIHLPCETCGKPVRRIPWQLENRSRTFCSNACYSAYGRGRPVRSLIPKTAPAQLATAGRTTHEEQAHEQHE